jgi:hypothetical protein
MAARSRDAARRDAALRRDTMWYRQDAPGRGPSTMRDAGETPLNGSRTTGAHGFVRRFVAPILTSSRRFRPDRSSDPLPDSAPLVPGFLRVAVLAAIGVEQPHVAHGVLPATIWARSLRWNVARPLPTGAAVPHAEVARIVAAGVYSRSRCSAHRWPAGAPALPRQPAVCLATLIRPHVLLRP